MNTPNNSSIEKEMLVLINGLRKTDRIEKTVSLPQIVVLGRRSTGEGSVLHAISGVHLPTDDELCKQFPIEFILRREDVVRIKASIRHQLDLSEQQCSNLEAFRIKWQDAQSASLDNVISDAKTILRSSACEVSLAGSLVIEVCGPDQENLTLIDLPGSCGRTQTDTCTNQSTLYDEITEG